ncbi:MAG: 4-hydroxy-tetrahydrodipicolinate reductase [Kofleriaceae bacterium]|nr:4-hydroxy-tetrahydrodipicolinate reductase [Kofleriaceae bacterium]
MRLCVLGPSGRMGAAVIDAADADPAVVVAAAVDRQGAAVLGSAVAADVIASDDLSHGLAAADVYVDFTMPLATAAVARAAIASRTAAVIGTTGLDAAARAAIDELAAVAPVVVAANFSLGVNLVLGLCRQAARALGPTWDTEIVELHHRAKRDAPSGTAIAMGRAIAAGVGADFDRVHCYARAGEVGARPDGEIGVVAVRGGDVVGEHTAYFFGPHERVEISHRATDRGIFAAGAVRAAAWVVTQPPGRYDMLDVLGLA